MPAPLVAIAVAFVIVSVALFSAAGAALRQRRWLGSGARGLLAALFLALALLAATISVAIRGYRALTHEEVAAVVRTEPLGFQRFRATVTLADGTLRMLDLSGDALYVDAHILKWHPWVNVLGLHTAYELDRIAGRYNDVRAERSRPRTVESLGRERVLDMFELARRFRLLAPLVDAEYGSATFVGTREPATFEVRVSTSGLLVRRVRQ